MCSYVFYFNWYHSITVCNLHKFMYRRQFHPWSFLGYDLCMTDKDCDSLAPQIPLFEEQETFNSSLLVFPEQCPYWYLWYDIFPISFWISHPFVIEVLLCQASQGLSNVIMCTIKVGWLRPWRAGRGLSITLQMALVDQWFSVLCCDLKLIDWFKFNEGLQYDRQCGYPHRWMF